MHKTTFFKRCPTDCRTQKERRTMEGYEDFENNADGTDATSNAKGPNKAATHDSHRTSEVEALASYFELGPNCSLLLFNDSELINGQ